jgi:hypothetical protein
MQTAGTNDLPYVRSLHSLCSLFNAVIINAHHENKNK